MSTHEAATERKLPTTIGSKLCRLTEDNIFLLLAVFEADFDRKFGAQAEMV